MSYSPAFQPSRVSTDNSSSTLLTAGSTFTGTWEDVSAFDAITLAAATDQDGSLILEFSPDGTNTDSTLTRYYRTGEINPPHRFTVTRKFARVKFTNTSASDQTYLRLQTMLGSYTDLNAPIDGTLSNDFDAIVTRPTDYQTEVALGRRQGSTAWQKFGYNDDVDTASAEVVAEFGGAFTPITSATTLDLVSSSANDDGSPAGTGANSVIVYGVDANHNSLIEVVTLNGTTTVTTSNSFLGVNRVSLYVSGSLQGNAGKITVTATTGGATWATIPAGEGTTQQVIFHTQADHVALIDTIFLSSQKVSGSGASVTFKLWVYSAVSGSKYEIFRYKMDTAVENSVFYSPKVPLSVGEKSNIWLEADTGTNNTSVAARLALVEYKDVDA